MWWLIFGLVFLGACFSDSSENSCDCEEKNYDPEWDSNGGFRVRNWHGNGFVYSDGTESCEGFLGEEYRSDNTLVTKDSWGMSHVYDRDTGEEIAIEYTDSWGMRHRENKSRF